MSSSSFKSAEESIRHGSQSFYFASLFFPKSTKESCWKLYQWCRYCDDQVDKADSSEAAALALEEVQRATLRALQGEALQSPVFRGFYEVSKEKGIPQEEPLALLKGFAMDVEGFYFRTLADLELYAYRVAGVVGLMMARVMDVTSPGAASHAVALGNAMQLTNIARDIHEDFERGRIYLPEEWLRDEGLSADTMILPENREALFRVTCRLLDRAEELYHWGRGGLHYIPWRARLAVSMASLIYRHIGTKIRHKGPAALEERVYVPFHEKVFLAFKGASTL